MKCDLDHEPGQAGVQFSLSTLLMLVTLAAVVVASITEVPEWIGAPVLALVATTAAAVVLGAAIRSREYALTFFIGAAIPLSMLVVRTALVLPALANGFSQQGWQPANKGFWLYTQDFAGQRLSYRWEAASALAAVPLIGLVCVAVHWLGDKQRDSRQAQTTIPARHRRLLVGLACLIVATVVTTGVVSIRALKQRFPQDGWDAHDGSSVAASGKPVDASTALAQGDRVLVEQGSAWWRGRIKNVGDDGNVTIHYVGWESNFDETVPRSRLQLP